MNDAQLPNNDQDRLLARQLRRWLEDQPAGEAPASNDPLFETLRDFHTGYQAEKQSSMPSSDESAQLWTAIEAATRPHQHARIHRMRPSYLRYAIAASLLVAVALSWVLMRQTQKPQLLAEAGNELVTYSTEDGSQISLRPHSKLYALQTSNVQSSFRLEGEAFFDVVSNPARTFTVESGDALVAVLGTEFLVTGWTDSPEIFLQEGRVQLTNQASGQELILEPGNHAVLSGDDIALLEVSTEEELLDWLSSRQTFTLKPVEAVLEEMAFHFNIRFVGLDDFAHETISGTVVISDQETALSSLGIILGGTFVQTTEDTYRFDAN